MNAFDKFLKNAGGTAEKHYGGATGAGFLGLDIASIAGSDNKLKALLATVLRIKFEGPMMALGLMQGFSAMRKGIIALVHDTGSLDAALKKLTQIQGMQRTFAPLLGGLDAAKRKVAELTLFSAKNNENLGAVGEAARSLNIYTRGAYDGSAALKTIGDAAADTGNGMAQTADAVGQFYAALRDGQPIAGAAENLRQMGLIGQDAVDRLVMLQQNGASVAQVFGSLTATLATHSGAMDAMKDSVEGVSNAYDTAKKNLQEKLGEPFTAEEIENTKNLTDAMNSLAPTVGRLSQFFATLTGGFSTAYSWMAKTAAASPALTGALEATVKAIAGLVTLVSGIAGLGLGAWLLTSAGTASAAVTSFLGLGTATGILATAIGALGVAIETAMIATGIGAIIAVLAAGVGIYLSHAHAADRVTEAVANMKRGYEQAERSMQKQIDTADTLVEKHEAIAAAIEEVKKAQDDMNDSMGKKGMSEQEFHAKVEHFENAKDQLEAAQKKQAELPTNEETEASRGAVAREREMNDQRFQNEYDAAGPARRVELLRGRAGDRKSRYERAKAGIDARASYSRSSTEADNKVLAAQGEYDTAQRDFTAASKRGAVLDVNSGSDARAAKRRLQKAQEERAAIDESLPEDSSVYAEMQARKATNPQDRKNWQEYAQQRKQEEANVGQLYTGASQDDADAKMMAREQALALQRAGTEKAIADLKSVGVQHAQQEFALRQRLLAIEIAAEEAKGKSADKAKLDELAAQKAAQAHGFREEMRGTATEQLSMERQIEEAKANREGNGEHAVDLKNLDDYVKNLDKTREVFGDNQQARDKALALTNANIEGNAPGVIASSLARIGGGGGVADPMVGIAEQQRRLAEEAKDYQKRIADATERLAGRAGAPNKPADYEGQ